MRANVGQISELAKKHLGADADKFLRWLRPAGSLEPKSGVESRSYLGGRPVLSPDQSWPEFKGRPLSSLATIALSDLAGIDVGLSLPDAGVLNFFYDVTEQPWGFDPDDRGSWAVLHSIGGEQAATTAGAEEFNNVPLAASQVVSFPNWGEDVLESLRTSRLDDCFELLDELRPAEWPEQANHQLGGWPLLEQGPLWVAAQLTSNGIYAGDADWQAHPRYEELVGGASDWRLLLQVDSDERAGWMWGDVGKLYFVIRADDLAERRFDRVWLELQCG